MISGILEHAFTKESSRKAEEQQKQRQLNLLISASSKH
jgi:hypothetical protein